MKVTYLRTLFSRCFFNDLSSIVGEDHSSQTYPSFLTCRSCDSLVVLSAGPFDGLDPNRYCYHASPCGSAMLSPGFVRSATVLTGTFSHQSCYHTCRSCM
jgi:hypothetical protein